MLLERERVHISMKDKFRPLLGVSINFRELTSIQIQGLHEYTVPVP